MSPPPGHDPSEWDPEAEDTRDPRTTIKSRALAQPRPQPTLSPSHPRPHQTSLEHLPFLKIVDAQAADGDADLQVSGILGEGTWGRVELGEQACLGRQVAIKRVRLERSTTDAMSALAREGRVLGALEHPSIVPVHIMGRDDAGAPVLVMKRIEGSSWRDILYDPNHTWWGQRGKDQLTRHLEILDHVCNAMHFAHQHGIVHRDLKAENVMLGSFGEVYVVDWGLAVRLGAPPTADIEGTPAHMAPEMLQGTTLLSVRTDVYLLGALLYEILTHTAIHEGDNLAAVLGAVERSEPAQFDADVPVELADLVRHATAKDPRDRPVDVQAFQEALHDFQQHRASVQLSKQSDALRREFRAALVALRDSAAQADATSEDEQRRRSEIARLFTEARFGYQSALNNWPENPAAAEGIRALLVDMIDRELEDRNVGSAAALLHELGDEPALALKLATLRAHIAQDATSAAALARVSYDENTSIGSTQRAMFLTGVNVVFAAFWMVVATNGITVTHAGIMGFGLNMVVTMLLFYVGLRVAGVANQFNRQVVFCLGALGVYICGAGWVGMVQQASIASLAQHTYLALALMFAVMAFTMARAIAFMVPPALLATAYSLWFPEQTTQSLVLLNVALAPTWWMLRAVGLRSPASSEASPLS